MTREILKSFGALAFYVMLIVGVIYVASVFAREMGFKRVMIPQALNDFLWYKARVGGFNLVDYTRTIAFLFLAWFPAVIYWNILSASSLFYPPSVVAQRADVALTKLAKVDDDDIRCFQISPNCLSIRHSARATFAWTWYRENEAAIELPVGVDFYKFILKPNSEVLAYFQYGTPTKVADILIEQPDKPGNYFVIRGNGGSYVYVYGNHSNYLQCTKYKIGWTDSFDGIEKRVSAGMTWETPHTNLIAVMEVANQQAETAIHDRFDHARVYPKNKPGREIFYATDDVKEWVGELIKKQTTKT